MPSNNKLSKAQPNKSKSKFVVDEIHVQVIVRELNENGETVNKHTAEPIRFVNETTFREWAAKPLRLNDQRDT